MRSPAVRRVGSDSLRRPPDERLNARQQFREGKRFGQIIIATGLQSLDAVIDGSFGAENEHRGVDAAGTELLDEFQTVEFW